MRLFSSVVFLHAVVSVFANGKIICIQDTQNGTLQFQSLPPPPPETTVYILLLRGMSVHLDCCLNRITNNTVITWEANGTILSDSNTVTTQWALSEQQQVLTVTEPGLYVCTATDGQVSITKIINITARNWDPTCRQGTIGGLRTGYPPTDVYDVAVHTSQSLTCEAVLYCGSLNTVSSVQWWKIQEGTEEVAYYLHGGSEPAYSMDATTGDWVNATAWYEDEVNRVIVIRAVLNIQNVTRHELYDENVSGNNCSDNSTSACSSNDEKYYYQCFVLLEDSGDPSSDLYTKLINTRLHSYSATNSTTAAAAAPTGYRGLIFLTSHGSIGYNRPHVAAIRAIMMLGGTVVPCSLKFREHLHSLNAFTLTVAALSVYMETGILLLAEEWNGGHTSWIQSIGLSISYIGVAWHI